MKSFCSAGRKMLIIQHHSLTTGGNLNTFVNRVFVLFSTKQTIFCSFLYLLGQSWPRAGKARLDWDRRARIQFGQVYFGAKTSSFDAKNVTVTNREIQLTSFDAKNVTLPTGKSNWPSLMQKTWRYQQGDPTDLLWCKKRDRYQQGGPTDLIDV